MLIWKIKKFDDLTLCQMHDMYKLRSEVFVVEQNCVYLDVDGRDGEALHVLGYEKDQLVAYTRIFLPSDQRAAVNFGRVVVAYSHRQKNYGRRLIQQTLDVIAVQMSGEDKYIIDISAQEYLLNFYASFGFSKVGEPYLEDDLPHIRMVKK